MASMPRHQTPTHSGTLAHIRIDGELHRKHFPKHTPPSDIKAWLLETEMRYRGKRGKRTGYFDDDARAYLETVKAMPTFAQRKQHIDEWIAAFGHIRRSLITPDVIRAQLHTWRTEPRDVPQRAKPGETRTKRLTLSAAACNKRRTALMHLYNVLDGKSEPNPVKDVPKFPEPRPAPRGLPMATVAAIFDAMPVSKAKARLMVIAYTGLTPIQIAAITPEDVDLDRKLVAIQGRRKGAGTLGRILALSPYGIRAFKLFIKEEAFGAFAMKPLRLALSRACKAIDGPTGVRPYDLRHSFGTEVYRSSGDIRAAQILLGHSTPALTHRYTLAATDERAIRALALFGTKRRAR